MADLVEAAGVLVVVAATLAAVRSASLESLSASAAAATADHRQRGKCPSALLGGEWMQGGVIYGT